MNPWWLRPPAEEAVEGADRAGADRSEPEEVHPPATVEGGPALKPDKPPAAPRGSGRRRSGVGRRRTAGRQTTAVSSSPEAGPLDVQRRIALFCDLEDVALGMRQSGIKRFDIELVLEHLLGSGRIVVKRAYADWDRCGDFKRSFHEAGIELIDIPQKYHSGKSSTEVKLSVDAMELCFSKQHLDTFIILSGDGDLSPLACKLKENNRRVIGIGIKRSASKLLVDCCDEFLYYEDICRGARGAPEPSGDEKDKAEAFSLLLDAIQALERDKKEILWGSMVKQTMRRLQPSFNEGSFGYSAFSELLEDAERNQIIRLERNQRSGSYVVTRLAKKSS